mgnify:CR=1 FL=1
MNYLLMLHENPPIVIHQENRKAYFEAMGRRTKSAAA